MNNKNNDKSFESLPTFEQVESEIKNEKYKSKYKSFLRSAVNALIVVAAVAVLIATLILPVLEIAGTSMNPTLNEGDIVVLIKTSDLKRGDICGFSYSNKILIKRVIGLPKDIINIEADGTVYINDKELDEPYITEKALGECDVEFPYEVPENQYFVIGDLRTTSIDSRSTVIGCVPKEQIVGKLFFRLFPFTKMKFF